MSVILWYNYLQNIARMEKITHQETTSSFYAIMNSFISYENRTDFQTGIHNLFARKTESLYVNSALALLVSKFAFQMCYCDGTVVCFYETWGYGTFSRHSQGCPNGIVKSKEMYCTKKDGTDTYLFFCALKILSSTVTYANFASCNTIESEKGVRITNESANTLHSRK